VDTNVWLAGLFKPNEETASYAVLNQIKQGHLRLCMSTEVSFELSRVIVGKLGSVQDGAMTSRVLRNLLWILRRGFKHCEPTISFEACTQHPSDDKFIDCAYEAGAVVVSKNTHLLDLDGKIKSKEGQPIRVLTPEHFMRELRESRTVRL